MRHQSWLAAIGIVTAIVIGACATQPRPVIERLDETTGVTVSHSRTPFVFASGKTADSLPQVDLVRLGAIEINRMGTLNYYLWFGITEYRSRELQGGQPRHFESVVLILDGDELLLDAAGWSHTSIGTSAPVYRKLFESSIDAYYAVDLDLIERLAEAREIGFRTAAPDSREYTPTFDSAKSAEDLSEFYRVVTE